MCATIRVKIGFFGLRIGLVFLRHYWRHRPGFCCNAASRLLLLALLLLIGFGRQGAQAADSCTPYLIQAEQYYQMPTGLLRAIAQLESGGEYGYPWAWAINDGGKPRFPTNYGEAINHLRTIQGKAKKDIAVGCMQIHMRWHDDYFKAPEWALNPYYNVWYAANYLYRLRLKHGNWTDAVGRYHASNKAAQRAYICGVWSNLNKLYGQKPDNRGNYCSQR